MKTTFLRIKSAIFPINSQLLRLKLSYFLIYSSLFSSIPYISIISTQLIDYGQLSILFICAMVISTLGPIITGFMADKLGIYKPIIIAAAFLMGFIHLPILWLESAHRTRSAKLNETIQLAISDSLTSFSSNEFVFPILLLIRILGFVFLDATLTLLDAAGLWMSKKYGADFGQQKMAGSLSMIIVPVFCGLLIDAISEKLGYPDYSIAFYLSAGFVAILMPIIYRMEIQVEKNKQSIISTAQKVIAMIDVDVFLLVQIFVGACMGFHLTFLSVFVDTQLIASKTLYGFSSSCAGISSVISLSVAKPIIDRLGEANTVALGLMLYSIRFIGFYFLQNPWILIVTESLEGFCGFLSFATGSYFCSAAAPPGMLASLNGILAAATFGLGRGMGTAVGSFLISSYGIRLTYLLFAVVAGSVAISYLAVYHLALKKMEHKRLTRSDQGDEATAVANGDTLKEEIEMTPF